MKMIYAIVHSDDANAVVESLNQNSFSVTKLATTGGFLRKGNATLLIGTDEDKVQKVIDIIREECGQREQIVYNTPYMESPYAAGSPSMPMTVDVGGATVFVVDVERFERL